MEECGERERKQVAKQVKILTRKAVCISGVPVPQTDTGRKGEDPQASGRSVVKELGKMTP